VCGFLTGWLYKWPLGFVPALTGAIIGCMTISGLTLVTNYTYENQVKIG